MDPDRSYCFIHRVHEDVPFDAHMVCFECGHVYETRRALVAAYRATMPWSLHLWATEFEPSYWSCLWRWITVRADTILFCQFCLHDF